jgi:cytochrome c biogenesis protein CcmG/thiol:disulfide interchange protein DsbE
MAEGLVQDGPQERPRGASPARALLVVAGACVLLAAVAVAYSLGQRGATAPGRPTESDLGEPAVPSRAAPDFSLPSLRGAGRVALADFRGHVVVINFFASWCGPCALEAADLERAWQAGRGRGVTFLGIAIQDEPEAARAFLARHGVTYPAAIDTTGDVMRAYRVTAIPTTFFVDPAGRIVGSHAGIFVGDEGVRRLQERIERSRGQGR